MRPVVWYYVGVGAKHVVWKECYLMQGSLAKKLRVLRAERGLTLREAANLVNIRPATLSDIEHGHSRPQDLTLAKIAGGYGVPVEDLFEEPDLVGASGKAEAPEAGPGPSLLEKALDAPRRDAAKDAQAINRLVASEGALEATVASGYAEDEFRAELRARGVPDELFEDLIWPLVELAAKTKQLEEQLAACEEERRLRKNRV